MSMALVSILINSLSFDAHTHTHTHTHTPPETGASTNMAAWAKAVTETDLAEEGSMVLASTSNVPGLTFLKNEAYGEGKYIENVQE